MSPDVKTGRLPTGLSLQESLSNLLHEEKQMTVKVSTGASSASLNWDAINWRTVQKHVRRLQIRIAKADAWFQEFLLSTENAGGC